jgi:hypothetical protein
MSRLIDFYRGTGTDTEGRTLAQVWAYSDVELESIHDFIQWIFPLREPSQFNPDAPRLSATDIAAFRSDTLLQDNLRRSFTVFLAFLGLRYDDGAVVRGPDFEVKAEVWRFPNHNWLRITRVLTSVRLLGLEDEGQALFAFLKALRAGVGSGITNDTFGYWARAASEELA